MKKIVFCLIVLLLLISVVTLPAMAETSTLGASVTVTEFASVTITDVGDDGLVFGSIQPGTVMQAEINSPAVTVTAATENNVDMTITISGVNFSDGGTNSFNISNAYWNDTNDTGTANEMTATATQVTVLAAGESVDIYHWLSIPESQAAASYSSNFTYSGN